MVGRAHDRVYGGSGSGDNGLHGGSILPYGSSRNGSHLWCITNIKQAFLRVGKGIFLVADTLFYKNVIKF